MAIDPSTEVLRNLAFSEAEVFALPTDWQNDRTLLPGVTIDSESTLDRDDAIWLDQSPNGHNVRVSISDVGSYIVKSSAVEQYALHMGQTRYLRSSTIPMSPPNISERALSLLDNKQTPVLSVNVSLDKAAHIGAVSFSHDRIDPIRLTYTQVNQIAGTPNESHSARTMAHYKQFALGLLKQRKAGGAFAFYEPEHGFMTSEDGTPVPIKQGSSHSGELIVQEFMVLANTVVAEYMAHHNVPAIYRNHQLHSNVTMDQAVDIMMSGTAEQVAALKQGFGKARYDTSATGHAALNVDAYTHWTSPLRRFADFANHANLVAHLSDQKLPYSTKELKEIADHLNNVQDEISLSRANTLKDIDHAVTLKRLGKSSIELLSLDNDAFLKVIKMAAKTGALPTDFLEALTERAAANQITPRELKSLLFNDHNQTDVWEQVNSLVLNQVTSNPNYAVMVLYEAKAEGLIEDLDFAITISPDGKGFVCKATIRQSGRGHVTTEVTRQSKKTAQQQAAVNLIALVAQPNASSTQEPDLITEVAIKPAVELVNTKGFLQEYFQKRSGLLPGYITTQKATDGTNFIFETMVSLDVNGQKVEFKATGPNKKTAENNAAALAIESLELSMPQSAPKESSPGSSPVSALIERSQELRIAMPVYEFKQKGPAHKTTFECTVTVVNDLGESIEILVSASSKQAAKTLAAQKALKQIGNA